jgi:hypothetical protein
MIVAEQSNGRGPVYPDAYMLNGGTGVPEIMSFTIAPGVVRPPEDASSRLAMFYVPINIGVRVNVANPYSSEGD